MDVYRLKRWDAGQHLVPKNMLLYSSIVCPPSSTAAACQDFRKLLRGFFNLYWYVVSNHLSSCIILGHWQMFHCPQHGQHWQKKNLEPKKFPFKAWNGSSMPCGISLTNLAYYFLLNHNWPWMSHGMSSRVLFHSNLVWWHLLKIDNPLASEERPVCHRIVFGWRGPGDEWEKHLW